MKKKQKLEKLLESLSDVRCIRVSRDYFKKYSEAILSLDYAMVRFARSELGFKIKQNDPKVYFTAKRIPETKQIAIHLRFPANDEDNDLPEHLDIDIYFPQEEIKKVQDLIPTEN